jgi:tRNA wybutosine-synthesizing protein 5
MNNLLIQVSGTKKVVLYSPADVDKLYLKGDKSKILDIDNPDLEQYPLFAKLDRYECTLTPGDVLSIPGNGCSSPIAQTNRKPEIPTILFS